MKSNLTKTPSGNAVCFARFRSPCLSGGVLVLLVLVAYSPCFRAGYVWDDRQIVDNTLLKSPAGLKSIWLRPSSTAGFESGYWPLAYTTFWLEHQVWGEFKPYILHMGNVLLHTLNALLVWIILRRMGINGAWFIAAVFALHPVRVESVAWVAQRKDVLSAFFYLSAFWCYLRAQTGAARRFMSLCLICFALAMLSKSIVVTLPVTLLIYRWYRRGTISKEDISCVLPVFLLGGALAVFGVLMAGESAETGYLSWLERFLVAGKIYWFYLSKLLLPVNLIAVYPKWHIHASQWTQYLYPLSAFGLTVLLWGLRRKIGRGAFSAMTFFGVTLLPVMGFVYFAFYEQSYVADRYQYLASIGPTALMISFVLWACDRVLRAHRKIRTAMASLFLTLLILLTARQCSLYVNMKTLFEHCLKGNPNSIAAHVNLADALANEGRFSEAEHHLLHAESLNPGDAKVQFSLGVLYMKNEKWNKAAERFQKALDIRPNYPESLNGLGASLSEVGLDIPAAKAHDRALQLDPNNQEAVLRLALIYGRIGLPERAIEYYRAALKTMPDWPLVLNNLAWILTTAENPALRDKRESVILAEKACQLSDWADPNFILTLAEAYAHAGNFEDAAASLERALRGLNPSEDNEMAVKLRQRTELYKKGICAFK